MKVKLLKMWKKITNISVIDLFFHTSNSNRNNANEQRSHLNEIGQFLEFVCDVIKTFD